MVTDLMSDKLLYAIGKQNVWISRCKKTRDFCIQAINMVTDIENEHGFTQVFDEASTEMQSMVHETARSKS